jgi:hypothetical protein
MLGMTPTGSLTFVGLALLPKLAGRLNACFGAVFAQVLVCHDLTTYKLVLKVRAGKKTKMRARTTCTTQNNSLNDSGRLGSLGALSDGPRSNLIRSTGEVSDELRDWT